MPTNPYKDRWAAFVTGGGGPSKFARETGQTAGEMITDDGSAIEAAEYAAGHAEDPKIDMNTNDLHAGGGQICPVCRRPIHEGQPVRKRVDGSYQHDAC
jgi:hypothetical protein